MRYGTALVTDVQPKTLVEDYESASLESLAVEASNIAVPHDAVISLLITKGEPNFRLQDLFIGLTMRRQVSKFQFDDFERDSGETANQENILGFCMLPLAGC